MGATAKVPAFAARAATHEHDAASTVATSAEVTRAPLRRQQPHTLVVSVGYTVFGLFPEQGDIAALPVPADIDDTIRLAETVAAGLEAGSALIVIHPGPNSDHGASARIDALKAALGDHSVIPIWCALPPLAASVFVSFVSSVTAHVDGPGVLAGLTPMLERSIHAYAWFGSLRGVRRPRPNAVMRARSVLGSRGFVAAWSPQPVVVPAKAGRGLPAPELRDPSMLVAAHDSDPGWMLGELAPRLGAVDVSEVPGGPMARAWWGTSDLVEAVVFPRDPRSLVAAATADAPVHACGWCDTPIITETCPLCAMSAPDPGGDA